MSFYYFILAQTPFSLSTLENQWLAAILAASGTQRRQEGATRPTIGNLHRRGRVTNSEGQPGYQDRRQQRVPFSCRLVERRNELSCLTDGRPPRKVENINVLL